MGNLQLMKAWLSSERLMRASMSFKTEDKSAASVDSTDMLFALAPILRKIIAIITLLSKHCNLFNSLIRAFFLVVAFPDARAKAIPGESQNVNCLPLECLAFTIRKDWALLREIQCACPPELHSIINLICFSSLSASPTCYEPFVWLTVQCEREGACLG